MALNVKSIKGEWKLEEQYVLRVRDQSLSERIRKVLREEGDATKKLQLVFDGIFSFSCFEQLSLEVASMALKEKTHWLKTSRHRSLCFLICVSLQKIRTLLYQESSCLKAKNIS